MPHYADYHRTVIGYHGTRRATALAIVQGERGFESSANPDDWLGHGIYFWEYAPQQAFLWARDRKRRRGWDDEIAVLGSMIRLGNCFDLLDPENVAAMDRFHNAFVKRVESQGGQIPRNVRSRKYLNCAVFQFAYAALDLDGPRSRIDTCRSVFIPTGPTRQERRLWDGAGINREAHIQICVRNPACILGTWLVKPKED